MILEHDPAAVNDEDNDSQTALHLACIHGKYDVVELLLDKVCIHYSKVAPSEA